MCDTPPPLRALAADRLPCARIERDPDRRFEQTLDALSRALREEDGQAWTPIVIGSERAMTEHAEALLYAPSAESLLSGPASEIAARLESGATVADVVEGWEDDAHAAPVPLSLLSEPASPWRPLPSLDSPPLAAIDPMTGSKYEAIWITIVPGPHAWRAPADLVFGGWNRNPLPTEHVAIQRHWARAHGARLIAVGARTLDVTVESLPESWSEAFALAQQHIDYCPDLIEPGAVNLRHIASRLRTSHLWSFHWR